MIGLLLLLLLAFYGTVGGLCVLVVFRIVMAIMGIKLDWKYYLAVFISSFFTSIFIALIIYTNA
ncbi:hypothetical protein [Myroides marinus]|uniref:hypothetical protein n=1 Tax=Myroides marinus TaxID=703342 RepID=UPI002575A565|nr:hypothetical protein [Myroides marinus]MDM1378559.1 hypothetical protein [Myroides marinus]MDM1385830.1 hypothetical protein [Myroides marinus]MDM1393043.1 hypothetical protein [Myroides marinus]